MTEKQQCGSLVMVRPEHLNHQGYLFGGRLLLWLDEQAYMFAMSLMDPAKAFNLVTVGIDKVEFKHGVQEGAILEFKSKLSKIGRTSITIHTSVEHVGKASKEIFGAFVTFVALDMERKPTEIMPILKEKTKA